MDEQPVALATIIRSPNSWETSLRYGVSPQPLQASENSNSGSSTWAPLTVSWAIRLRSSGGIDWKNSQCGRSISRCAAAGSRLMDLCLTSVLLLAGQRELEERLEDLGAHDGVVGDQAPVERRDRLE